MPPNPFTTTAHDSLGDILSKAAANQERLKLWSATHAPGIATHLVFGSIVWKKALGRPSSQKMSDGFTVSLTNIDVVIDYQQKIEIPLHAQFPVDQKWDDSDEDNYLVHFLHDMPHGQTLTVMVRMADGVGWQDSSGAPSSEHLIVSPSHRSYGNSKAASQIPNLIDPFWVITAGQARIAAPSLRRI